jgi:hypothetical protein
LTLAVLAVLDQRGLGPEFRKAMREPQIGDMLDLAGGPRKVLAQALAACRRR